MDVKNNHGQMNELEFSKRYGYEKIEKDLLKRDVPIELRTRIWNCFYLLIFRPLSKREKSEPTYKPALFFIMKIWDRFLKEDFQKFLDAPISHSYYTVKNEFFDSPWYKVYDFVEFFIKEYDGPNKEETIECLKSVLKEEGVPYRIVNDKVVPFISDEEIKEIEKALGVPDKFKPVRGHLEKALKHMSNREDPDYANSIKESISAIESLVEIIQGKEGTLGDLLKTLDIHPALKMGFSNLYGWTCDEGGIRHGKTGETLEPGFAEARYMLVTASAFINYLIEKLGDKNEL